MKIYCTYYRGIGYSNRTSVVHNYSLGEDICAHCGGIVPLEKTYGYMPRVMDFHNKINNEFCISKDKHKRDEYSKKA